MSDAPASPPAGGAGIAWIVAGLGNPGDRYVGSRHDLGFMLADRLAREQGATFDEGPEAGECALAGPVQLGGSGVLLAKPLTYMNRSGLPLRTLLGVLGLPAMRLLVACDDIHLPLGRARLRLEGGPGGHNGLASVIAACGREVPRLRLGVGGEPPGADRAEWVLGRFEPSEIPAVDAMLARAARAVAMVVAGRLDEAHRALAVVADAPDC